MKRVSKIDIEISLKTAVLIAVAAIIDIALVTYAILDIMDKIIN